MSAKGDKMSDKPSAAPRETNAPPDASDRERVANWARAFLESYFGKKWSGYQLTHLTADVAMLEATAFKRGQQEMRERAAQEIDQANLEGPYNAIQGAARIRALPLSEDSATKEKP